MIHRNAVALLLGLLAFCAAAGATPAPADDSFVFKPAYRAGEKEQYRTSINIEGKNPQTGGPLKVELTLTTTEQTREVRPDGTVVLQTTLVEGVIRFAGSEIPLPNTGQTFTTTLDRTGKIVKQESSLSGQGNVGQILGMTRMQPLQDVTLKVGEPYKFETPINDEKELLATGTVTLLGPEKKSADVPVDSMKIKSVMDTPVPGQPADQKMHVETTAFVEPGTCKTLRTEGVITGKMGPLGDSRVTFKRARVEAAKPAK